MRFFTLCAVTLTCAVAAVGQSAPSDVQIPMRPTPVSTPTHAVPGRKMAPVEKPLPSVTEVPPSAPVITLHGVCEHPATAGTCKTVITRAQMDSLTDFLLPNAPPEARRQFALRYARLLAATAVAEQRHLDKNPAIAKMIQTEQKYMRMQVLSNALYHQFDQQAAPVATPELQKYYKEHSADFESAKLRRLEIPGSTAGNTGKPLNPATVKAKAEELRARAVAGEDFDQLQQAAYKDLEVVTPLPPTTMPSVRRTDLNESEQKALDLKPGEISEVIETFSGFVIFKMESKETLPFDTVEPEIVSALQRGQKQREIQKAGKAVTGDFNLAYMGLNAQPELFPPNGMNPVAADAAARARMMSRRRAMSSPTVPPANRTPINPTLPLMQPTPSPSTTPATQPQN